MTPPSRAQQLGLVVLLGLVTLYVLWTVAR
jgi:hypothetical protein